MKNKKLFILVGVLVLCMLAMVLLYYRWYQNRNLDISINLTELTYTQKGSSNNLKTYSVNDFITFKNDYDNNNLDDVYVTEFLFDGVSMVKPYDLDDYIENGNDYEVDVLEIKTLNINTLGSITLSGEFTGMVAVNTNDKKGNINIILDNVKIDTNSKKVPVIYVYNKSIDYTDAKVTIIPKSGTSNYLEGGKLKKTSLVGSDVLTDYTSKYQGEMLSNYNTYTNYYGIYTSSEINNILFATVTADGEDLQDGDPYYFYKASGAISSDIDLYFNGSGYLEVVSKNKEGIETKGNLELTGGVGDYLIKADDDCLNTTTKSTVTNARNTLVIDVNSLVAIVNSDADEGDAIDSNGTLTINGGNILAIAKSGSDAGLDSESGTYINGGVVIATGDMYDQISSESSQRFMVLSFNGSVSENTLITLLDSSDNVMFSYLTDRTYTNLIYSSSLLNEETYYLYKDGEIVGNNDNGLYNNITSYSKGTQLGYSSTGGGMIGGNPPENGGNMNMPSDGSRPEPPSGNPQNGGSMTPPDDMNNPPSDMQGEMNPNMGNNTMENSTASIKEFTISGISNLFSGVAIYSE